MELAESSRDLQLTLSLTDADLLRALRPAPSTVLKAAVARTRPDLKSNLIAQYSTKEGTLTFSALLRQRWPIQFSLKAGSRSYENFIRFLLRELELLAATEVGDRAQTMQRALEGIRRSLPGRLEALHGDVQASAADVEGIVELFRSDIEEFKRGALRRASGELTRRRKAHGRLTPSAIPSALQARRTERRFRLLSGDQAAAQLISGFFSVEIEEVNPAPPLPESCIVAPLAEKRFELLRTSLTIDGPEIRLEDAQTTAAARIAFDPALEGSVKFFLHWGRLQPVTPGSGSAQWIDEEILGDELIRCDDGSWELRKPLGIEHPGMHGLTGYVRIDGSSERLWFSELGISDRRFEIQPQLPYANVQELCRELVEDMDIKRRIVCGLSDFKSFTKVVQQLQRTRKVRGLGKLIYDAARHDARLRETVSAYYRQALLEYEQGGSGLPRSAIKRTITVLQNLGIGEVVFVAPEGPHAIAGGLAQVIVGLIKALSRCGISCTVVTPLYEEAQGSKHAAAEEILARGVTLLGKRVPLTPLGDIKIPIGGTKAVDRNQLREFPSLVTAQVYEAQQDGVRLLFLRNRRYAERLYGPAGCDEQLRRAIFLSRGALELVRDRRFHLRPHLMITNDWLSALVPVYLKTDPRYADDPRFAEVESCHVLHNCGRAYQGRLPLRHNDEDLWPLLGLEDGHVFGLKDPDDDGSLNLTAAAAFHTSRALVAVSKPYASQLMTFKGGEGLHQLFTEQGHSLFGISNGVDLAALRAVFREVGEAARRELGLTPLRSRRRSQRELIDVLPEYKSSVKQVVQRKYGLIEQDDAPLLALVGRLAEQKGIQLLTGTADGDDVSVLEAILRSFPTVQFMIAGPPSHGDPAVVTLEQTVAALAERYPGRICGVFNFIPHEAALEITQASDLFLMPSRYEPGGITQLEALAAGTLVVARNVGGLKATLVDYSSTRGEGDSFLFNDFSSTALKEVICRALSVIDDAAVRRRLIAQAALAENDWSHRVPKYLSILQHAAGVLDGKEFEHLSARRHLLASLRAHNGHARSFEG